MWYGAKALPKKYQDLLVELYDESPEDIAWKLLCVAVTKPSWNGYVIVLHRHELSSTKWRPCQKCLDRIPCRAEPY